MLLLPIAIAIAGTGSESGDVDFESVEEMEDGCEIVSDGFGIALLLGVAYGASIGGAATLIGSTPNAIFAGIARSQLDVRVGFVDWMVYSVPIILVTLFLAWVVIVRLTEPVVTIDETSVRRYQEWIPKMERDERRVILIFGVVIIAWLVRPFLIAPVLPSLTDPVIAILGGIALFLTPTGTTTDSVEDEGDGVNGNDNDGVNGDDDTRDRLLSWPDLSDLPWDVLILIGGSFAVAYAFQEGRLDEVIAQALSGLGGLSLAVLVVLVVAAVMTVSNLMSNTASVTVFLPILVAFAPLAGVVPIDLMAPVALAASFVFVLPVATPPNAIAYSSGYIDIQQMVRVGIVLNLLCLPVVAGLSYVWLPIAQPFG